MNIVLSYIEKSLGESWKTYCSEFDFVKFRQGSILDVKCDAVVSPANSFGFMNGGIDAVYTKHFGIEVQNNLQEIIRNFHHGELLVGNAEIVGTEHGNIPYLIAAPTMRVPKILESDTINPYLSIRAVLLLVKYGKFLDGTRVCDKVQTIAFPGMGTGVGGVPFDICAHQMKEAINSVLVDEDRFPINLTHACRDHVFLYRDYRKDTKVL